jgi:transketolase
MGNNLFDATSKHLKKKIRQEFADTMLEIGQKDSNLIVLIGDISHFVLQPFANACPGRFYNVGICEPAMVNMAAGLSKVGFFPVIHTIAPFLVERSFEQIKLDFGYQKLGVNIISVGSAFDYGALGCTHHCYNDFALMKTIEGMQVIYPASCKEFNLLFKQTYNNGKPTYFRLPESQHEVDFNEEDIIFGKGMVVKEGKDITIVALGPQLRTALNAVSSLELEGIDPEIIYIHTIKPLDEELIIKSINKTKRCLVIEEHSKYGGVFDDILRSSKDLMNIKYSVLNIGDKFVREYGTYDQHCQRLGLSVDGIVKKTKLLFDDPKENSLNLGKEIDLLSKYPKTKRNVDERGAEKSEEDRTIARKFGKEFFDGDRKHGYGGFFYNPRFWTEVVKDFIQYYGLTAESKILDVGCGKGFMLYDFIKALPGLSVQGIDISEYAISHCVGFIKDYLSVGDAHDLSKYKDKEFDLVISINTIHNLKLEECKQALREVQRVGKRAFITNDAWRNDEEKEMMKKWNLTGETMMHVDDWKKLFEEVGYSGDFYWFIP